MKHTPGPWIVQGDTYVTVNNLIIAHCKQDGHSSLDEAMANARLIASAPDLLATLIEVTDVLERLRRGHGVEVATACYPALNNARALIDKINQVQS